MSQNLINTSIASLTLQLPSFDDRALIKTYEALCQWKRNEGHKVGVTISEGVLHDVLRKEARIEKEMFRRGLIQKAGPLAEDFNRWKKKMQVGLRRQ